MGSARLSTAKFTIAEISVCGRERHRRVSIEPLQHPRRQSAPYAIPACSGQALLEIIIKSWLRQRFRTRESAKWTPRPFDATLR
jgi:hypothetical protein